MVTGRHRIAYIDGLRAVAVLGVVVFHAAHFANVRQEWLVAILRNGSRGVDLFFVLSGFCLSYPTLERLRRTGFATFDIARYAAHRIVRIVPPFWIAIVLIGVLGVAAQWSSNTATIIPSAAFTVTNLLRTAFFFDQPIDQTLNSAFWTLPLEFRWYFFFPIALLVWVKYRKSYVAIMIGSLLFGLTAMESLDPRYLAEFMLGIVAADLYIREVPLPKIAIVAGIAAVIVAPLSEIAGGWGKFYNPLWFPATFAIVVASGRSIALQRLLSMRWLTAVGVASYSIYLVHAPIIELAYALSRNIWLSTVVAIAAGFAFWWFAERPFVSGRLRSALVSAFEEIFRRRLPQIGIGNLTLVADSAVASVVMREEESIAKTRRVCAADARRG